MRPAIVSGAFRLLLSLVLIGGCQRRLPPDFTLTPVLLIHGYGQDHTIWTRTLAFLADRGYPPEYLLAIDLVPSDGSNIHAAEEGIAPAVAELLTRAGGTARIHGVPPPTRVDLVSHSMGSLSARWYAARLAPERVRTWISLSGANHGTAALCPEPTPGGLDLCPEDPDSSRENQLLRALNGAPGRPVDETPYGIGDDPPSAQPRIPPSAGKAILYFSIRMKDDRWITPHTSAMLAGAGGVSVAPPHDLGVVEDPEGNFVFRGKDHDFLWRSRAGRRLVALLLASYPDSG